MFRSRKPAERRDAPRQEVAYRLDVVAPDGRHGCLLDISGGGMRVRFTAEQDLSACEKLVVELPRWLALERELRVRGRFVWLRRTESGATEAGFAFADLSRKDQALLDELLRGLARAVAEDRPTPEPSLPA